jgi:hypothetical protein
MTGYRNESISFDQAWDNMVAQQGGVPPGDYEVVDKTAVIWCIERTPITGTPVANVYVTARVVVDGQVFEFAHNVRCAMKRATTD